MQINYIMRNVTCNYVKTLAQSHQGSNFNSTTMEYPNTTFQGGYKAGRKQYGKKQYAKKHILGKIIRGTLLLALAGTLLNLTDCAKNKRSYNVEIEYTKNSSSDKPVYVVKKDETIYSIAKKYNVSQDDLMKTNGISSPQELIAGQELVIPGGKKTLQGTKNTVSAEQINDTLRCNNKEQEVNVPVAQNIAFSQNEISVPLSINDTYTVKPGETIYSIAKKYNVSRDDLMKTNGISSPQELKMGQQIIIPVKKEYLQVSANVTHTVKSHETVYGIAKKYNVSQDDLMKTNGISSPQELKAGQEVIIPHQ